jgi:xanthine dehydrogenase YagS FAD-binding subunit
MQTFAFASAPDVHQAALLAQEPDVALLAGGTELLNWMRLGIAEPARVLDIGGVGGLDDIRVDGQTLVIGALATLGDVGAHTLVGQHARVLAEACLKAASGQIRHRATLGGNVLQKTRCAYFRSEAPLPWGCNKRAAGSGCAAIEGHSEGMAIFGHTPGCAAVQPSDPVVALACLDAVAVVEGPSGPREIPMTGFHLTQQEAAVESAAAGADAQLETRLRPGEVITQYRLPLRAGERSAYVKVRERESYEYALVSAAATVRTEGGRMAAVRIALGSVAQKPWRLDEAERALAGQPFEREAVRQIVMAAVGDARPLKHNGFKIRLAANAAVRAIETAGGIA